MHSCIFLQRQGSGNFMSIWNLVDNLTNLNICIGNMAPGSREFVTHTNLSYHNVKTYFVHDYKLLKWKSFGSYIHLLLNY